jgi:hypothetical protein
MHLLMTDPLSSVDFCSDATSDPAARDEVSHRSDSRRDGT